MSRSCVRCRRDWGTGSLHCPRCGGESGEEFDAELLVTDGGIKAHESEIPWKTAPEFAREGLRALSVDEESDLWQRSLQYATEYGLQGGLDSGHRPSSVAGGAIYLAGVLLNSKHSQREVAEAVQSSVPAIRDTYYQIGACEGVRMRHSRPEADDA